MTRPWSSGRRSRPSRRRTPPAHTIAPSPKDAPGLSKGEGISILVGRFLTSSGWRQKWELWNKPGFTPPLAEVHTWLMGAQNIGTFDAGQHLADHLGILSVGRGLVMAAN
jgi:hypothetical protein